MFFSNFSSAMDLIQKMLSMELPPTSTQRFTYKSAFVAYFIVGLTMIIAPDLWNMVLQMDFGADGKGYFILFGSGLVDIGICLVVLARNKASQVPNAGPLIGTVFNRLVIVNAFVITFYTQGIANARLAAMMSTLDSTLAILTYVIWAKETVGASLNKFFQDIWSTINPLSSKAPRFTMFYLLGVVHLVVSLAAPSILISTNVVPISIVGRHAEGLFRGYCVTKTVHALFHMLAAGSQNDSYPIAAVFYRLICDVPVCIVLGFFSLIPFKLAIVLVMYDVIFVATTIMIFSGQSFAKVAP